MSADRYDIVIVGGGSAGCALANRLSADPGTSVLVLEAGRSDLRWDPFIHMPAALPYPDRQPALRLEVRDRPRAPPGRAAGVPRPRQGARRLQQHQRDDLPARQPARLRALGGRPGHGAVGLPALPAVLQEDGDLLGDDGRPPPTVARRRRAAAARARTGHEPALRRLLRGRPAGRLPAHRRRQRLPPGGVRAVRPQRPPGPPALRRAGLPPPGAPPREPARRDAGDGDRDPVLRATGPPASTT